ncbi:F0F1-type ATP synthase, gamma subunit [Terriglobus roseus DSM 18391]|uniref:ATP synthase gamma chain n=1 Tax=Terriglobus roseus (strain DSM 18391 / NRRL B-41598 / KBS 63) TaxID=926566 RepID=I3ZLE2_TERRK|nr:FoF1 ATP synthase subunit gamma [Terriglobus roseus]AFL90060.1 F0F1-type ATP synthase, gamma subunit [Terriglobus roseus DSM 18391]
MANVLDLKRRIRSVKNTRQITKAMKMVSAAKLRRAQERALQARPYAQMLANVLQSLVRRADLYGEDGADVMHPLLVEREEKNVLVLVIAGDKGFAGAFNSNIGKAAQKFIDYRRAPKTQTEESPMPGEQNIDVETVGRKARDMFKRRYPEATWKHVDEEYDNGLSHHVEDLRERKQPIELTHDLSSLLAKLSFGDVDKCAHSIIDRYERGEIDSVYIVYNEFKSVIAQRVVVEKLLPIRKLGSPEITVSEEMTEEQKEAAAHAAATAGVSINTPEESQMEQEAKKFGTADVDYLYDQDPSRLFRHLLPRYVTTQIYHALLESVASEHASRMTAMDAASSNASDMIDKLTLTMNRVRQAAITTEIIEIVSGAAAL